MKKNYLFIALSTLAITFGCEINAGRQSITVHIDEGNYTFKAAYPKHKTNDVVNYLKNVLKQDDFFSNAQCVKNEDVILNDGSKFHVTAELGFIEINFNKRDTRESSYKNLIRLCTGIKEELR